MADTTLVPKKPLKSKKQSPLDILEDILDDAQEQKEARDKRTQELAEKAALQAKQEASEKVDLQQIALHRAKMDDIKQTPAEQARVSQIKEMIKQKTQQKLENKGFEIRQLGHDKI